MDPQLKSDIAVLLKIENNSFWNIFDSLPDEGLVLVHHTVESDLSKYGWIKGIIIDTVVGEVVCQSYSASINVSLSMQRDIEPVVGRNSPKPSYRFKSLDGQDLSIPTDQCQWVKGHDGALVRVWKHARTSKIYISSHKKINTDKEWNSWGGCPAFTELYTSLSGPKEALFTDEYAPSNVYTFMLLHPRLQVGSRLPLNEPKLLYLGVHSLKPTTLALPTVLESIERPDSLSLAQANEFLNHGYYPSGDSFYDPRAGNGEFVMLFQYTDSSQTRIERCIKVMSDAYRWRVNMRSNESDLCHLVFQLAALRVRDMKTRMGDQTYHNRYLSIALPELSELPYLSAQFIPRDEIPSHQRETAIASLVYATHPSSQKEVLDYYAQFLMFLPQCIDWIMTIWRDPNPQSIYDRMQNVSPREGAHTARRFKNMIDVATSHQQNKGFNEEEYLSNFKKNIRFFIENEYGSSLYQFYKVYNTMNN